MIGIYPSMDLVPDDVVVTNRYGEQLVGSFSAYGRDISYARREQYAAPFVEVEMTNDRWVPNEYQEREAAEVHVRQAIVALNTAGTCLLRARQFIHNEDGHGLASALRDDITNMVGDAEALLSVVHTS